MAPSLSLQAALSLHNAKRIVSERRDYAAWWMLDAALWEIIWHDLSLDEREFIIFLINAYTMRWAAA
jgi:hypothetical protein